ncbi:hypothetical protein AB0D14_26350 [Streptomyces sp. NPDC048484]|uniref:hypothetical protein n=1 Tax=Streptomyces sp. NPDC048484 TaxID=3155146 RepID=UPI00341F01F1
MPHTPNARLRLLLDEADWSGARFASAVRAVAAEHGHSSACDASAASRWLSGAQPRPPAATFILEALSRKLGRPVTAVEAGLSRAPAPTLELSWEADPLQKLSALTDTDLDPTRRRLLSSGLYRLTALTVPDAFVPRRRALADRPSSASGIAVSPAGAEHAEQMQTMATAFAQVAAVHGGGHVRTALTAYLRHDVAGYLYAPAPDSLHRSLLTGTAQLTLLLGGMCADDGADSLAQHYHRTAIQLAAESHDPATYAIALRTLSTHAHSLGHHAPAVFSLAERAAAAARHAPSIVRAYTQAHLSVMQAHHDRHAALAALTVAERHHDQATAAPGPFTAYSLGALHYQRAQTLATLGDRAAAVSALASSLRVRTPEERHAEALTRASLAETLLSQGQLEAALKHWDLFLDTCAGLHSARAVRRLHTLRRLLHPHRRHRATAALLARAAALR